MTPAVVDLVLQHHPVLRRLFPFLEWVPYVNRRSLRDDLFAGLTGAFVVIPQAVAFALIAGLPPQYGLYTAIVVPVVAALFGSSWHLVSGPTTAISIVVFSVVSAVAIPGSPAFVPYALSLTFLAGLFQFLLGLARMGTLVNFISHTVVIGFTAGAAVLIAASQLRHFLGLPLPSGESLLHTLALLVRSLDHINPYSAAIAVLTLVTATVVRRLRHRWPAMLIGLVVGSIACLVVDGPRHGVALVGALPGHLPPLSVPDFSFYTLRELVPGAMAVAMLGLIEAVSIGRAVATRSHQRIDGNQEFIGQGLSNMVGSFFSCYAASGSFTRSGINYDAGAKTPLSAVFSAAIVALVLVFLAPLTAYLPMPAMAGIIVLVAWNLVDFHHLRVIARASKRETTVMVTTFLATLFFALEFAIYAGVMLSLVLYLQRTSHPRIVAMAPNSGAPKRHLGDAAKHRFPECPQLKILRIDGSLFFGAVDHVQGVLRRLTRRGGGWKHVLILGSGVNFIDVAGAEMLVQEARRLRAEDGGLYLCGIKDSVRRVLTEGGYEAQLGEENVFANKAEAIGEIFRRLDPERCALCTRRIFRECATVEFQGQGVMD